MIYFELRNFISILVLYGLAEVRMILNGHFGDWFLYKLKKQHSFLHHLLFQELPNLAVDKVSL